MPEAACLTGVSASKIRGWINGYTQGSSAGARSVPLIHRQIPVIDGKLGLGFLDLLEVKFIKWLSCYGVSWHSIRIAADRARVELGHEHPFALARFHTDGKAVFLETQKQTGDRKLMDLNKNNFAMYEVLESSFRRGIVFDDVTGIAASWQPSANSPDVILDPQRSFGRPIDVNSGVPTAVLAEAYEVEGSLDRVASWYGVTPDTVHAAVAFELEFAA